MSVHTVYRGNAVLVELRALKDAQTKAAITDASPTATLYDLDDASLGTASLTHDASGTYFGTISPATTIPDATENGYVVVTIAGSYLGRWEGSVDFKDRKF